MCTRVCVSVCVCEWELGQSAGFVGYTPGYVTKESDSGAPEMPGPWRKRCIPSLPSLPGPVVASDPVLSIVQIEHFDS